MASQFLLLGLVNAVLAVVLAALLGLGLKWRYNAHIAAVLWILVLLKFVSPPLAPFSIERRADATPVRPSLDGDATSPGRHDVNDEPATSRLESKEPVSAVATSSTEPADAASARSGSAIPAVVTPSEAANSVRSETAATAGIVKRLWRSEFVVAAWLGGFLVALVWLIISGVRFHRLICSPRLASEDSELTDALRQLCRRWRIARVPQLRVVDARISPLVWTWFGGTTLVVPRSLLASLSPTQREMLLAHELAHLLRRDHLVRWLEAAVQSLYWWLPVVPWVRRKLHAAQEDCCDAFVQREFPGQSVAYCDALLAASTWLQGVRPSPVWASEFGTAAGLRHRIQTMLEQKMTRPVSRLALAGCVTLGLIVCAVSVRWVQADPARQGEPRAAGENGAGETEFLITDQQGVPVPTGKLHLRGYYDNNDFFELDRPIDAGRATYDFQRPRVRKMWIEVSAPKFLSHSREYEVEGTDRGFPVERRYSYRLNQGVEIGGRIVDESGDPLENVHVFLSMPSVKREDGSRDSIDSWFQTDAEGQWSCPGIFSDMSQLKIRLEHATHVDESSEESWPQMRPVKPEEFDGLRDKTHVRVMHEDPPLVGKVVGPDGQPVAGVTVDISGRDLDWSQHYARGMVIKTNEAGEFRLPRPPRGEQRLTLLGPGSRRQVVEMTVDLAKPLKVTLTAGRRMEFRVMDINGEPVPGVTFIPRIPGSEFRGKTGADGRWIWEGAPDTDVDYQIGSDKYLCQPPDSVYSPDDSPVTLTLRRKLPVIGKVVDGETGEPIPEFRLYSGSHFKSNRPGLWSWWMETTQTMRPVKGSWAEGKVSVNPGTPLEPGRFQQRLHTLDRLIRYRVQADGYLPEVSAVLDAADLPDKPVELEFRLKKYSGIIGQVRTPDGAAAAGAQVVTSVRRGNDRSSYLSVQNGLVSERSVNEATVVVQSDAAGRFELPVHNDPFVCLITHPAGYLEIADRELGATPELTLLPWKTVEGTVAVQGSPAAKVDLDLHSSLDHLTLDVGTEVPGVLFSLTATTDADGQYRVMHGTPGTWDVRASYPSPAGREQPDAPGWDRPAPWRSSRFEIDIAGDGPTRLDIGRDVVDIIGRVVVPDGVSPDWLYSGVQFHCDREVAGKGRSRREFHQARLSEDGSFRCYNVPAGDFKGTAIIGEADDRVWHFASTARKRGYEGTIQLPADMFEGKSTADPIDVGKIAVEEVR